MITDQLLKPRTLPDTNIERVILAILSGAGGAMARRRRDLSPSLCFFFNLSFACVLFFVVFMPFKPVCPEISNLHQMLTPLFDVASFNKARRWPPANYPLLTPCGSKTTYDEAFISSCAHCFKSESCLLLSHGSARSVAFSDSFRRTVEKTSATNLFSAPEPSRSVSMPFPLPPATTDSIPIIDSSPYCLHAVSLICPSKVNLGFSFLGFSLNFGPLSMSRPITKRIGPFYLNDWPRYVPSIFLLSPSQLQLNFPDLSGRRHHLRRKSITLQWSCVYHPRTLLQILSMATFVEIKILRISDRRCDFAHRFSLPADDMPTNLCNDLKSLTITNTSTAQIMLRQKIIASPMRDLKLLFRAPKQSLFDFESLPHPYPSLMKKPCINSFPIMEKLSITPSSYMERTLESSCCPLFSASKPNKQPTFLTLVLLRVELFASTKIKVLEPSSTSQRQLTVTINSHPDLFVEVPPTHRKFACTNLPSSFWLQTLMDYKSAYLIYLVVALGNASYFHALNFGIYESFLSLYLNLVCFV